MRWWSCLALVLGTLSSLARGAVYPSCLVANVTWDPSLIIDTIPSVQTPEDCQANCSDECSAFTWKSPEDSEFHNLCLLFTSANETIPCTDCVSGPPECLCSTMGECSMVGDNVLGLFPNVPNAISCHQFCGNNSECNFFTYFSEGHQLQYMCLIFSSCEVMDETCEGCISGPKVCETCDFDETVDGKCIIDEGVDYLFLGPGYGTDGQSELLHLPTLETTQCTVPVHPSGAISGYVGTLTEQGPVLCGGATSSTDDDQCHLLSKTDGNWIKMNSSMNSKRGYAASVVLPTGEWWVTGGYDGSTYQATTELWYNYTWSYHHPLPTPLDSHCMLQYNNTHTFITGGWTTTGTGITTADYWYTTDGGYVPAVSMGTAREGHGCTVDSTGLIYVAGGRNNNGYELNSVEIFSPSSAQWSYGPDLPVATAGGVMLTVEKDVVFIGGKDNKKIWSLVNTDGEPTGWREVGEMKQERVDFSAIKLTMAGCEEWS